MIDFQLGMSYNTNILSHRHKINIMNLQDETHDMIHLEAKSFHFPTTVMNKVFSTQISICLL